MSIKKGYKAILMFGVVSLFGDIIYEGARSLTPSYLQFLGADIVIVGFAFGLSEFLGYALRLVSGILTDVTRAYWIFYITGYVLIAAIPIIGFTNSWIIIVILIIIERIAKAFRSPARDTLISVASKSIGAGKAFGLHELLDQVGAIVGPALVVSILYFTFNNYSLAYIALIIPYLALISIVLTTYLKLRDIVIMPSKEKKGISLNLPSSFWAYIASVGLNTMGLIHISLILYVATKVYAAYLVAMLYLLVQAVDAVSAPLSGYLYDKYGRIILIIPFIMSILPSILTAIGSKILLITSAILFGVIYGMQESIYRAAVSDFIPSYARGTAYGVFNSVYGLGFLISGVIYGFLIKLAEVYVVAIYAVCIQIIALTILVYSTKLGIKDLSGKRNII